MVAGWYLRESIMKSEVLKMELIRAEKITKKYSEKNVLNGINFTLREKEFVGIMGKSGSGKTTLLKILSLIEPMTTGTIYYEDQDAKKISGKAIAEFRRKELGFVFQEFFLMDSLTALENVLLPLYISREVNDEKKTEAVNLMERFEIQSLQDKMPNELSGGEKQRVAICRALINNPKVIFADEPTGNLDSKSGGRIISFLDSIHKELGKTIVMVTHDPQMASHCDRVVLLKDGEIQGEIKKTGSIREFYREILERMIDL